MWPNIVIKSQHGIRSQPAAGVDDVDCVYQIGLTKMAWSESMTDDGYALSLPKDLLFL